MIFSPVLDLSDRSIALALLKIINDCRVAMCCSWLLYLHFCIWLLTLQVLISQTLYVAAHKFIAQRYVEELKLLTTTYSSENYRFFFICQEIVLFLSSESSASSFVLMMFEIGADCQLVCPKTFSFFIFNVY